MDKLNKVSLLRHSLNLKYSYTNSRTLKRNQNANLFQKLLFTKTNLADIHKIYQKQYSSEVKHSDMSQISGLGLCSVHCTLFLIKMRLLYNMSSISENLLENFDLNYHRKKHSEAQDRTFISCTFYPDSFLATFYKNEIITL